MDTFIMSSHVDRRMAIPSSLDSCTRKFLALTTEVGPEPNALLFSHRLHNHVAHGLIEKTTVTYSESTILS